MIVIRNPTRRAELEFIPSMECDIQIEKRKWYQNINWFLIVLTILSLACIIGGGIILHIWIGINFFLGCLIILLAGIAVSPFMGSNN